MRGHKLGLLTTADYNNLCQCETLEDIKLYLVGLHGVPFRSSCTFKYFMLYSHASCTCAPTRGTTCSWGMHQARV